MPLPSHATGPESHRTQLARLLDPRAPTSLGRLIRVGNIAIIAAGVVAAVVATDPAFRADSLLLLGLPVLCFALEFAVRLWVAPERTAGDPGYPNLARLRWVVTARGLIDLAGAVAVPVSLLAGAAPNEAALLGLLWVLKLARYSQGLDVLARVIQLEAEPLVGVLFAFVVVLLGAAVLAHLIEGEAQPDAFGTVPKALWWTIVTLTTTGYGDVTPQTGAGRVLGGVVMVCGIMVFALWTGILATGFSQEMRRRAFLRTWDLVARVPLFHDVGAAVISEVAQRLRPREVTPGTTVLRKGEIGDCMYFIVSGEIEVEVGAKPLRLRNGDFIGELSLITGARRNANATATKPTQLLILDIADFRDMAARHPDLTNAIRQEAERRLKPPTG